MYASSGAATINRSAAFQQNINTTEYNYTSLNNPQWQKLLWVKQNYPDNYVDSTFLDELQRNGKIHLHRIYNVYDP